MIMYYYSISNFVCHIKSIVMKTISLFTDCATHIPGCDQCTLTDGTVTCSQCGTGKKPDTAATTCHSKYSYTFIIFIDVFQVKSMPDTDCIDIVVLNDSVNIQ